jgi:ATP-dependent Clp protease ATP-binding subunit ClpX
MEHALLDVMFDLPSMDNVSKVVLEHVAATDEIKSELIYTELAKAA